MQLFVIRAVTVNPTLYLVGVSASPDDRLESLRQQTRRTPIVFELAGKAVIDSRRALTIEGTIHHVLTTLGLAQPRRGWFSGDANLVDFLNADRLAAWFMSTPEITNAAQGFVLPVPRQAPEPSERCQLRTAKGTRCTRQTRDICFDCGKLCCGPHRIQTFPPGVRDLYAYCRPCYRGLQRWWDEEERQQAKAKARAAFEESGPDCLGFEDFDFSVPTDDEKR